MYTMTKEEVKAYLNRIGIAEIQPPTKNFLFELHKAHVSKISWQTVDIYMGDPSGIDIEQSIALILGNRSGYCFHLNGAFSTLLRTLGYQVSMHRAGVQPPGTEPRINSFHLGLTATLNNEQGETETYIVDAGLGDMPYEPLPLRFGTYKHGPLTYQVVQSEVAAQGWRLLHDPRGSSVGVDFDSAVVSDMEEFKPKHEFYSQSADSPWTKLFLAKLRNEHGSYELRGCMWNTIDINGVKKTEITNKSQWLELLGDVLGEQLVRYNSLERDELWKKVYASHVEWKKSVERSKS